MSVLKKLFDVTTDWIRKARSYESREAAMDEHSRIPSEMHTGIGENIADVNLEQSVQSCTPSYWADLDHRHFQELLSAATEYHPQKSLVPHTLQPPNAQELSMEANLLIRTLGDNRKGKSTR